MNFRTLKKLVSDWSHAATTDERHRDEVKLLCAKQLAKLSANAPFGTPFSEVEFSCFSQFGDDGIIQHLIGNLNIRNETFIEFGVEEYRESNTRFLMINDNWSGLVMDASKENIEAIRSSYYYWKYGLQAIASFVTHENINQLISDNGLAGEVGLLHVDIDGVDYWIWKAIDVVDPAIVIVEYNSVMGYERPITVPYALDFNRHDAHYSGLYAGCSLAALGHLGREKGYTLVGCNSAGNNAYLVRDDLLPVGFQPQPVEDIFVDSKFRESRTRDGVLDYLAGHERYAAIKGLPVINVETGKLEEL